MKALSEYLSQTGTLKSDTIMGWIVMISFEGKTTDRSTLVREMNNNGFDGASVPPGLKQPEAFRWAARNMSKHSVRVGDNTYTTLIRDNRAKGEISKHIVLEEANELTGNLSYEPFAEVSYHLATDSMATRLTATTQHLYQEVQDLCVATQNQLLTLTGAATGQLDYARTRKVITGIIGFPLGGVQLRRSVYYVPNRRRDKLDSLINLAGQLSTVNLQLVPLVDIQVQRDMVIEAFREEATDNYLYLIERAKEIVSDKKAGKSPRVSTAKKLLEEYKRMTLLNREHIEDLQIDISTIRSTAESAKTAIEAAVAAVTT